MGNSKTTENDGLRGKTALVTGAARRIGRAVALALADEGVNVLAHYRSSEDDAQSLREEIESRGVRCWLLQADLAQPEQCDALIAQAREVSGGFHILINNASIYPESTLLTATSQEFAENMQVNAIAPLILARRFAQGLEWGRIINFLDSRITRYDRMHVAYHLSKRALFSLTRMMAIEFAPRITVNAVAPGLTLPPCGADDKAYLDRFKEANLLKRLGDLKSITDAVVFLLNSDFITGQILYVDGGANLLGGLYG